MRFKNRGRRLHFTHMVPLLTFLLAAAPSESWGLKWKAPRECIEPAQLARAVEAQLGGSVFGAGAKHRIDGELVRSPQSPKWRAKFIAVDAEGSILGSRELTSDDASCHGLDEKLAMVVAVMIDPKRQAPESAPPPPPPPPPRPEPPPPVARQQLVDPAAKEEYEKRLLHFGDWVAVNQTGHVVAQGSSLYEGKYMKPLTVVEFYERLGETERVEAMNHSSRIKGALAIPGGVLVLLGLTSVLAGGLIAGNCDSGGGQIAFTECISRRNTIRNITLWGGIAAGGTGLALAFASIFVPYPVDKVEVMREKADLYNRRLRNELGVEREDDAPLPEPERARPPPNPQASLHVSPMLVAGGAGAAVTVRF